MLIYEFSSVNPSFFMPRIPPTLQALPPNREMLPALSSSPASTRNAHRGMLGAQAGAGGLAGSRKQGNRVKISPAQRAWCSARYQLRAVVKAGGHKEALTLLNPRGEVGQKHFSAGLETSINTGCRGSAVLVCKGESCGGKM